MNYTTSHFLLIVLGYPLDSILRNRPYPPYQWSSVCQPSITPRWTATHSFWPGFTHETKIIYALYRCLTVFKLWSYDPSCQEVSLLGCTQMIFVPFQNTIFFTLCSAQGGTYSYNLHKYKWRSGQGVTPLVRTILSQCFQYIFFFTMSGISEKIYFDPVASKTEAKY